MKIKRSFGRYISLFIIILVGIGFCSGIQSSSPDIVTTADDYYKNHNLMNFKIVSSMGLTNEDVNVLKSLENVDAVFPSYSLDVLNNEKTIRIHAIEDVNTVKLIDGKMPENDKECLADSKSYKIGDKITVTSDVSEKLKNTEFSVVGTVDSVLYMTDNYGNTTIGDGKLSSFIFVNKDNFILDVYTEIYILTTWNKNAIAYSKNYDDLSSKLNDELVKIKPDREEARYEEIYNKANDELSENETKLNDEKQKGEKELSDAKLELDENAKKLEDAKAEVSQNEAMLEMMGMTDPNLEQAKVEISENEKKLEDGFKEYNENLDKFNTEIRDAEAKIIDAKKDISEIEKPKWHIFDRSVVADYNVIKAGTDTITSIATVFPIFFILIVMLMTSNTMTRMIEEERSELGTLASLGYEDRNIISTYLLYVISASSFGILAGFFIGCTTIPKLIFACFNFFLPPLHINYDMTMLLMFFIVGLLVMVLVTVISCNKELKQKPATLLRPVPPKNGETIFLEKIKPIWKSLSFTWKVTMRNMFRFKKRGIMTIIGVSGCTALLLAGFGIRDSISGVYEKQYGEIFKYDDFIVLKDETENIDENLEKLLKDEKVTDPALIKQTAFKCETDKRSLDLFMIVPEDEEMFYKHYDLKSILTNINIKLNNDGVIITQKLAEVFKINIGDEIAVKDNDNNSYTFKVSEIAENYTMNYLYLNKDMYNEVFKKPASYNAIVANFNGYEKELAKNLIDSDLILNVIFTSDVLEKAIEGNKSLNNIVILLVVVASLLAMVVLYNLTSINISERKREIATLKVLGFTDNETSQYIYREAMILTLISIIVGLALGVILHHSIIGVIEGIDTVFFKNVHRISFIWASLITVAFSLTMQIITYFKLKDINMIESLKSVE